MLTLKTAILLISYNYTYTMHRTYVYTYIQYICTVCDFHTFHIRSVTSPSLAGMTLLRTPGCYTVTHVQYIQYTTTHQEQHSYPRTHTTHAHTPHHTNTNAHTHTNQKKNKRTRPTVHTGDADHPQNTLSSDTGTHWQVTSTQPTFFLLNSSS